jgi:hypothetical protein
VWKFLGIDEAPGSRKMPNPRKKTVEREVGKAWCFCIEQPLSAIIQLFFEVLLA